MFAAFLAERSKIEVSQATHALLARLAERYPLAVITNGNLDLVQAGLADYFTLVCKAGAGARMKPAPDMFVQVQQALGSPRPDTPRGGSSRDGCAGGQVARLQGRLAQRAPTALAVAAVAAGCGAGLPRRAGRAAALILRKGQRRDAQARPFIYPWRGLTRECWA